MWRTLLRVWLFAAGAVSFLVNKKNFLRSLIRLELIALSVGSVFLFFLGGREGSSFLAGYLTLVVCEGALGFSVLVLYVREGGTRFFRSPRVLRW